MTKFGTSQSLRRREDIRLVTGQGTYVDDIAPKGALKAYVFRAPVAHAEITALDVTAARQAPGVAGVYTAQDLMAAGRDIAMKGTVVTNRDGSSGAAPIRPILATERVRFVGEPLAFVVAETLAQARDAAELIEFDFNELAAKVDVAPGGSEIHAEAPQNIAYDWEMGNAQATQDALTKAAHTVTVTVEDNRIIANSIEPRGCYAEHDGDRLHICVNGQGVWGTKRTFATWLNREPDTIRVTNPDVGGGFGTKAHQYPEHFLTVHAALDLRRAVHWMSDRTEAMLSDNAGRDLICTAEMGFDADYKLIAYRMTSVSNLGAYNSGYGQPIQSQLFAKVLPGVYDVQTVYMNNVGVYTNTTQVDAYRGAGRPEAIYVLERAMDFAARELGVDPLELRRKSFIKPAQFPYKSAVGELYDVGDFNRVLDRAIVEGDLDNFPARRADTEAAGKLRGLGICYYIESILGSPTETAEIEFAEDGIVRLYVGTQSNGQGHETVYSQFVSEYLGLSVDAIEIVQGDSDRIAQGGGTGGSRSVTTQGTATKATAEKVIAKFTPFVADQFEIAPEDIVFDDGDFRGTGTNHVLSLLEAAELARTQGREDLLKTVETTTLPGRSYPNGCHMCEVEIDPETGGLAVVKYTVVDDFGRLMNPMLAEGQVHGGVAQGIGQAVSEHVVYDDTGQLLTATFMDYGMPRAGDVPQIVFYSEPVPSTANVLGMKGCGEAGTVGAMAATANAVVDALYPLGLRKIDMPFTPVRVWEMLQQAKKVAVAAE